MRLMVWSWNFVKKKILEELLETNDTDMKIAVMADIKEA